MKFGHIGYIPAYIRHHPDLNAVTKLVYSEITANIEEQGYCKKKNSFFARVLGSSASTISSCITKLRRFNLIQVIIENEEDSNKFINRYIMLTLPEISVGVDHNIPVPYAEISVGGNAVDSDVVPNNDVEGAEISDTLLHSNNNIQYIYSIPKNKVILNKKINEGQLVFIKRIVNNFYTTQNKNYPEIIKSDWHKDSSLTNGSINVIFDLLTIDKWDEGKVRGVIDWLVKDTFWASKCYSLRVLRDKAPNGQAKFTNMYASYIDKGGKVMSFEENGISVRSTSGQEKTQCPKCSHTRRKGSDPCLSVNIDEGVWHCHHCGWKGSLNKVTKIDKPREVIKPKPPTTDIPEQVYKWFEDRGISQNVVDAEKIGYNNRWIQFPFYKDGEVVNIKSRTADKKFMQSKNAEKCFYRFDHMKGMETIIITEGEMDTLSLVQAGFTNVVSVPDGATAPNSKPSDRKFSYLLSAEEHLMNAKTIILCTDNDGAGNHLRDELSRRIGREKCYRVTYPEDCKDMNEVLVKHGEECILDIVSNTHPYPIEGVVTISDIEDDAIDLLEKPEHLGLSTGWMALDGVYRVSPSELTVITGVPNMGKSEWMDALMINMVQHHSWKFGIFSAENFPVKHHLLKLVSKFNGKPFWGDDKMDSETARASMKVMNEHIKFIGTQEDSVSIENILEQAKILTYRYGLNGLVIDPWNTLEHKFRDGENETNYVSRVLAQLNAFAKMYELHIWVVAHPKKMENDLNRKPLVPSPYDISGSANWYNKSDNAITIHRHKSDEHDYVGVHVNKIRFQYKNGKPNKAKLSYDIRSGRYGEYFEEVKENLFG